MTNYVYILSEVHEGNRLYTVGFYKPNGEWEPESDHDNKEDASARVHYLNGGAVNHHQELVDIIEQYHHYLSLIDICKCNDTKEDAELLDDLLKYTNCMIVYREKAAGLLTKIKEQG